MQGDSPNRPTSASRSVHLIPSHNIAKRVIVALEEEFDVNSLTYGGMRVWPWVRSALYFLYAENRGELSASYIASDRLKRTKRFESEDAREPANLLAKTTARLDRIRKRLKRFRQEHDSLLPLERPPGLDFLFVARGRKRSVEIQGKLIDPIFDPLARIADGRWSWQKLQLRGALADDVTTSVSEVCINEAAFMMMLASLEKAYSELFENREAILFGWEEMADFVGTIPGVPYDLPGAEDVIPTLQAIERYGIFFRHILDCFRPRLAFSMGHNVASFGLARACHDLGIASVDVQHGTGALSPENIKWFGWRQIPSGGYEILPRYFWVWGETAAERINKSLGGAADRHEAVVGGNQWLNGEIESGGQCEASTEPGAHRKTREKRVLVTLTQLFAAEPPDHLLAAMAQAPSSWTWMVRLHPRDLGDESLTTALRQKIHDCGVPNMEIIRPSTEPLPQILTETDVHVTLYSSTCIDASAFGIGTVFVHAKAAEMYAYLLMNEGFTLALDEDTLLVALQEDRKPVSTLINTGRDVAVQAIDRMLADYP